MDDATADDALQKVRALLAAQLDPTPADDADLWAQGLIDSFMLVELIAELEKSFEVELAFDTLTKENFASINAIADTMRRLTA